MTSIDEITISPTALYAENQADSPESIPLAHNLSIAQLKALVQYTDPCSHNDDRDLVIKALYHETDGCDDGLAIADEWSSHADDYAGSDELARKWQSLKDDTGDPITVGTLCEMVNANGFDWIDICSSAEPDFDPIEPDIQPPDKPQAPTPSSRPSNPLDRYPLNENLSQLVEEVADQVFIMMCLALMGQITVFYASPNTGKTLFTLWMLIQAIKSGIVDPRNIYYVNVDDSLPGLIEKLRLAVKYCFCMIAEGHNGFRADDLLDILNDMISKDQCKGVVIILDTLKKFTNVMDKRKSTEFSKVIRRFVMQGGTCIILAHTNKNLGSDGTPVYAGTSDILEDADCAYTLQVISDADAPEKVVSFVNIKRRGNVCHRAAYTYSNEEGLSYSDLFDSVKSVDDTELVSLKQSEELRSDAEVIDAVIACIQGGINTKIKLAEAVAERSSVSRRAANKIIEKYAGTDPAMHKWTYSVQGRGAKVFCLLAPDTAVSDHAGNP
jgi:hypothetical protein